jgi:hypothetical protein
MNRLGKILTLALALQLLLVVAVFWPRSDEAEGLARTALVELDAAAVDRIAIEDTDSSVLLGRGGDGWVLPDYHGLPVDQQKLQRVLRDLPALPRGWPVARSGGAAERFEVDERSFQRHVTWFGGESAAGEIYLGTSPGFRKVHTRIAGSDPVYAVEFNTFDLPVEPAEWLDKTLLRVATPSAISGRDYQLSREGEAWLGRGQAQAASAEVDKLVNGLTSLRVTAVADIALAAELEQMEVAPTLSVSSAGEIYEYRLYEMEDERYIKRSDIPVYFSFSQFDYDRLNEVNAASLYPAPETEEAPAAETAETDAD